MQLSCQILVAIWMAFNFFVTVYWDFNGKKAKDPQGFGGFVGTCVIIALFTWMLWGAGAFSELG